MRTTHPTQSKKHQLVLMRFWWSCRVRTILRLWQNCCAIAQGGQARIPQTATGSSCPRGQHSHIKQKKLHPRTDRVFLVELPSTALGSVSLSLLVLLQAYSISSVLGTCLKIDKKTNSADSKVLTLPRSQLSSEHPENMSHSLAIWRHLRCASNQLSC